ncbi:hypothetical protein Dsin_016695 [Dipteronia sinensis]|uniref:HTH CENPB-type domain-containing protein n=1 Tax=Dipteronia sinensis TaxID=43782 RepID=A0AAE0ADP1_9ROSI|nr:hypothetical protein Dsin_016695 [Dipteronia sinensis]
MSNPHITMTNSIRKELCQMKKDNLTFTQKHLAQWLLVKYKLKVSQGTISNTLRHSEELLIIHHIRGSSKCHKSVSYPLMEAALVEWVNTYQSKINISGDLIKEKGAFFLNRLYPEATSFKFSNGWLNRFKSHHGIKSFRRFGENGTVDTQAVEEAIPNLYDILDQYDWKDIYNMDETGLFYRLQAYYRHRFNCMLLECLESNTLDPEKIDILEAIRMAVAAWTFDVKPKTIANCFLHCKISTVQGETEGDIEDKGDMSEL